MRRSRSEKLEMAGRILSIVGNIFDAVIGVLIVLAMIYVISRGAKICYDYGYRIYTEAPVSAGEGREVTITIPIDFSAKELGNLFESNGLTRDHILFTLQYYASEFRENVKGGTYTLSTSMTAEEMFEVIANINILKQQEQEALEEAAEQKKQQEEQDISGGSGESDSEEESYQEINMNEDSDNLLEETVR